MPRILRPETTVLDRFTIVEQVTAGGQSIGYHGIDQEAPPDEPWRRNVFVKQYHDLVAGSEEAMRVSQHFEVLQERLGEHENLVCLPRGVGEEANSVIAVYPWVKGETLRDRMEEGLKEADYLRATFGITNAVRVLHEKGVAHLDLKPSNVVAQVGREEKLFIRIIDFDTAQIDGEGLRQATMVTPLYSSPEHYFPEEYGAVSTKSDIFTLGIVLFELLFKQHPFNETYDYPQAIENEVFPVPASDYHREVVEEITACLSAQPSDRPTAGRLLYVLNEHYDTDLKATTPEDRFEPSGDRHYVQLSSPTRTNFHRTYYDSVNIDWNQLRGSDVEVFSGTILRLVPDEEGCWLGVVNDTPAVSLHGETLGDGDWVRLKPRQTLRVGDAKFNVEIKKDTATPDQPGETSEGVDPNGGEAGQDIKEGSVYEGEVQNIKDFGAFVEIKPGIDGLVPISEIHHDYVEDAGKYLQEGERVKVKVLEVRGDEYDLTRKPFVDASNSTTTTRTSANPEQLLVDGLNVCYWKETGDASLDVLMTLMVELLEDGQDFLCICDANIRSKIEESDDEEAQKILDTLEEQLSQFYVATGGLTADDFLLQRADQEESRIISNDQYREYEEQYPWLQEASDRLIHGGAPDGRLQIPGMFSTQIRTDLQSMADKLVRRLG